MPVTVVYNSAVCVCVCACSQDVFLLLLLALVPPLCPLAAIIDEDDCLNNVEPHI